MSKVFVNEAPASLKTNYPKQLNLIVIHFTQNQSGNFSIAPRTVYVGHSKSNEIR